MNPSKIHLLTLFWIAAIYFKNTLHRHWPTGYQEADKAANGTLTLGDRSFVMDNLINVYMQSSQPIKYTILDCLLAIFYIIAHPSEFFSCRKVLLPCFSRIIDSNYDKSWPSLLPTMFSLFNSNDLNVIVPLLDIFIIIVCARNTEKNFDQRLFSQGFPFILSIANHFLSRQADLPANAEDESYVLLKKVCKIFMKSVVYLLPKDFQSAAFMDPWIKVFLTIIELPSPVELTKMLSEGDVEEDEIKGLAFWKMKKWAYHSLNRLFLRYGTTQNERYKSGSYSSFAKLFMERYAVSILELYMKQIVGVCTSSKAAYIPPRILSIICDFLTGSIVPKSLWSLLKSHLSGLIQEFILPRLAITDQDIRLWADDPLDYVSSKLDPYEDYDSVSSSCTNLLLAMVKKRKKSVLYPLLSYINGIFANYKSAVASGVVAPIGLAKQKDAALYAIGNLSDIILGADDLKSLVEGMLVEFVLPELLPESNPFLRLRACWVLQHFEETPFSVADNVVHIFQALLTCMQAGRPASSLALDAKGEVLSLPALPIRVQAAISIGAYLEFQEIRPTFISNIQVAIQILLELTNTTDNESLSYVMDKIINMFPDDLLGFSVELCYSLKESLMRVIQDPLLMQLGLDTSNTQEDLAFADKPDADLDDNWEKASDKLMSACGIFKTISTLIMTIKIDSNSKGGEAHQAGKYEGSAEGNVLNMKLVQLESFLLEPITFVLQNNISDLYDEVFDLIESLTFILKTISPGMWNIFSLMTNLFLANKNDIQESFCEMMPSLDNFISYGTDVIFGNPQMLSGLVQVISVAYTNSALGENEKVAACKLVESLLLHASQNGERKQVLGAFLGGFIKLVLTGERTLAERFTSKLAIVHHVSVILAALVFDVNDTLGLLSSLSMLGPFLSFLDKNYGSFSRVHDKHLLVLSCNVLLIYISQLSTQQSQGLSELSSFLFPFVEKLFLMLKVSLETLPTALAERKELEDRVGESSTEDEAYNYGDSDDDFDADDQDSDAEVAYKAAISGDRPAFAMDAEHEDDFESDFDDSQEESEWFSDSLEEELFMESPIDNIDYFQLSRETLSSKLSSQILEHFHKSFSEADKVAFHKVLEGKSS